MMYPGLLDGGVRGGHFFSSYNDTIKNPEVYLSPISPIRNAGLVLDTQGNVVVKNNVSRERLHKKSRLVERNDIYTEGKDKI